MSSFRGQILGEVADARAAGATYDPAAGANCVETSGAACKTLVNYKTGSNGQCHRVYTGGSVRLGGECVYDWSCAGNDTSDVHCTPTLIGNAIGRVCVRIVAVHGEGEPCGPAGSNQIVACTAPSQCNDGRCATKRLGDACQGGGGDDCGPGYVCDRLNTRRCIVPPSAPGEPCTRPEQCEGYRCENGRCISTGSIAGANVCTP